VQAIRAGVVAYAVLIDTLGFGERVTKRIHRGLPQEGLVALTAVPLMTTVGRPVLDHAHRWNRRQMIGITPHGVRLI
jgi:hypothetical protein